MISANSSYITKLEELDKEMEVKYDPAIERLLAGSLFPDATLILDMEGIIRYCAVSIVNIAGYEPEELVGKSIDYLNLVKSGEPLSARTIVDSLDVDKERVFGTNQNVTLINKNGEHVPVFVLVSHMIDGCELLFLIAINKGRRNEQ